jgi:hypothetical protein
VRDHGLEVVEPAAEGDLRRIVEMLIAEDEDLVLVERLPDRVKLFERDRRRAVDAGDFGDEKRMQARTPPGSRARSARRASP